MQNRRGVVTQVVGHSDSALYSTCITLAVYSRPQPYIHYCCIDSHLTVGGSHYLWCVPFSLQTRDNFLGKLHFKLSQLPIEVHIAVAWRWDGWCRDGWCHAHMTV